MRFSMFDGCGYRRSDNRASGGQLVEDDMLGCMHCHALIERKKMVNTLSTYAHCHACDGPLCTGCGLTTQVHGHGNPAHPGTMPHHRWIDEALNEAHRRQQNARVLGI